MSIRAVERFHQPHSQNGFPMTSSRVNPQASRQSRFASTTVPSRASTPAKFVPCSKKARNLAFASAACAAAVAARR